jgi:hypothetical protein
MSELPVVLDLFSGTGSATQPFVECGKHRVVRVDTDPRAIADLRCDVRSLPGWVTRERPEFIWASPPCQPFSTAVAAWKLDREARAEKGMELVRVAFKVARRARFWAVENVRGSLRWFVPEFGEPFLRGHAFYLWGNVPLSILPTDRRLGKGTPIPEKQKPPTAGHPRPYKHHYRTKSTREAGMIPRALSEAIHRAVCPKGSPSPNP